MKSVVITIIAAAALSAAPQPSWCADPGQMHSGGQPPSQGQHPMPQGQRPPEGELWQQLDKTMEAVRQKQAQQAEAERIERGGDRPPGSGPMSRGERESDRQHFLERNREKEAVMKVKVQKRQKLVNDMLRMYSKQPSPGLKQAIDRNSQKLSAEREELQRSREFIQRNR